MADPIVFPSTTSNFSLPLLFTGQAQKEPFINEAMSVIDACLVGTVEGSFTAPPSDPQSNAAYRVVQGATGDWAGHDNQIALWIGGAWKYVSPTDGLWVFDQAARVQLRYQAGWEIAEEPAQPAGGNTIDNEARAAISGIIEALRTAGIFATPG